jgi:hypothetical protein
VLCLLVDPAAAWCAVVVGESEPFGTKCGNPFSQRERDTKWHMKKVNIFYTDGCITGLKVQYGYNAADAQMLGQEKKGGSSKHLSLSDSEYITGVEVRTGNKCIEYVKFSTNQKQSLSMGSGSGMWVNKPRNNAYVFGFKGDGGGG